MRTTSALLVLTSVLALSACGQAGTDASAGEEMNVSMKELVALGKDFTCTFENHTDDLGMVSEGTLYVQGNEKFRADFVTDDGEGNVYTTHMISADGTSYMWSDETEGGMMVRLEPGEDVFTAGDDESTFDEDEKMDMNCRSWNPEPSRFTPPSDREFTDFKAQMDLMMRGDEGMMYDDEACAACDLATSEQDRATCREVLGC